MVWICFYFVGKRHPGEWPIHLCLFWMRVNWAFALLALLRFHSLHEAIGPVILSWMWFSVNFFFFFFFFNRPMFDVKSWHYSGNGCTVYIWNVSIHIIFDITFTCWLKLCSWRSYTGCGVCVRTCVCVCESNDKHTGTRIVPNHYHPL